MGNWSTYLLINVCTNCLLNLIGSNLIATRSSIALNLLGPEIVDPNVRAFAIRQLEILDDSELSIFMLHLTHALKFETFVDSALARFLMKRALLAPSTIGHTFFWSLMF